MLRREQPPPLTPASSADEGEEFDLKESVFKPRSRESEARAFFDTPRVFAKMLQKDWARVWDQDGFRRTLNRACKNSEPRVDEIVALFGDVYQIIASTFDYFACCNADVDSFSILVRAQLKPLVATSCSGSADIMPPLNFVLRLMRSPSL